MPEDFSSESTRRPYRIAISYASDQREELRKIVEHLLHYFSSDQIFYDELHTDQLARPNIDEWLRDVFGNQADLVVIFRSDRAGNSPWWQLEENAIKSAYDSGEIGDGRIMLLSFGAVMEYTVNFSHAGFRNIENSSAKSISELIIKRLERETGGKITPRPKGWRPWPNIRLHITAATIAWIALISALLSFGPQGTLGATITIFCWLFPITVILIGLYIGNRPSRVRWNDISIPDPNNHPDGVLLDAWISYATGLEQQLEQAADTLMKTKREMSSALRHERLVSRMLGWSVFLITVANCLVQLLAKHLEWQFFGSLLVQSGSDFRNSLSSFGDCAGTLATLAASCVVVFFCSFATERRSEGRFRLVWLIGFIAPLLAGLTIAGVDLVNQSSEIFPGAAGVNYLLAGSILAERLIVVPLAGLFCSLLASLIQPQTDRQIVTWSSVVGRRAQ